MAELLVKCKLLYQIIEQDGLLTRVVWKDNAEEVQEWSEWQDYHVCVVFDNFCIKCGARK